MNRRRISLGLTCSRGVTMLEVLIALAVLSVGLAGLGALQVDSVRHAHSAQYRSLASAIALDLEERLWLELADAGLTACPDVSAASGTAIGELIDAWQRTTYAGERLLKIPGLTVTVGTAANAGSVVTVPVTLSWTESRFTDEGEPGEEQFSYNVRVLCREAST